ncbi:MAG TPA: hypothetical protein VFB72_06225, partial [Verrucomicrobiae bacterium]|nr:hypothetical protein [Verrucomicrobiae bacterium]
PITASLGGNGNGVLEISWEAIAGDAYQVQYKEASLAGNWQNLGNPVIATNSIASLTDESQASNRQRFYRIKLLP